MPGIEIYEFVRKVHHQCMNIPVILIAEDVTTELAREAFSNGVCYLFPKPPSDRDIIYTWQHIYRVTGKLPALTDITSSIDEEKYGNPSNGSSRGGSAINRNPRNMKRKIIITDEENKTVEDDVGNPKKSRMTWTTSLHAKFLEAIYILGEHSVHPNSILGMMKEPGLTQSQVSSHLQRYRNRIRLSTNSQETAPPVMPAVLPSVSLGISKKEKISYTDNTNFKATRGFLQIPGSPIGLNASNFVGYTIEDVKRKLDTWNYCGHNTTKANSKDGHGTNIEEQAPLLPHDFAHMTGESGHEIQSWADVRNGFQAPNVEPAGVQVAEGDAGKTAQGTDRNYTSSVSSYTREQAPLVPQSFSDGIQVSGHLTNGLQDPNQEPTEDIETGMLGFRNVGNPASMNHVNFGEGTSGAHQQLSEVSENDDINKILQELEASEDNI